MWLSGRSTSSRCSGCCRQPSGRHTSRQLSKRGCLSLSVDPPCSYCGWTSAHARIDPSDTKTEPSLQSLTVLHEVDLICHLWQHYVNMALLPLASSSVTVRREMVVFNNQSVSRIEGAANHVMQRLADGPSSPLASKAA